VGHACEDRPNDDLSQAVSGPSPAEGMAETEVLAAARPACFTSFGVSGNL
jgi:hypothetical protein